MKIYNTLTRRKEDFEPINPPFVGIYLCGPTVYNDAHIGNGRPAVVFDVLRRYLTYKGYKVRFVRNITDVGHLLGDNNEGEDRISRQAKLEQLEPMEIVQRYTLRYHEVMDKLNVLRPDIEPTATGHILEQIEMTQKILQAGLAYEVNGSVYFDVEAYQKRNYNYGELSGRVIDELIAGAGEERRTLEGQDEKKNPADFALWKKAAPEHLMRWNSPWGVGFPGWHIECSVMSTKYLGETFDIHGGGMDLIFPHHECEIAQAKAANAGKSPVKYWMHNNMVTVNGQKMSKSLGNFISLIELFEGSHPLLSQAYLPMVVRLFILQAHYRSTIDFSNEALQAAQKNYFKLINAGKVLRKLQHTHFELSAHDVKFENEIYNDFQKIFEALDDDLNTALAITHLLSIAKKINILQTNVAKLNAIQADTLAYLQKMYPLVLGEILGIKETPIQDVEPLLQTLLKVYAEAKAEKNYTKVDEIRADLKKIGITLKDTKQGIDWAYME
ncbi:MAG: cysteine--tRNA ligase [Raineya sp.]|nr:cysteine--tRNA ligase [Raineya sp.]